jgi:two-component system, sensor histidine kinase and response regulator
MTEDEMEPAAKILLVDDKPENLIALERVLAEPSLELVKAASGNEALKRLLTDDFACVLLDVNMPEMDGFETAHIIRQDEALEHIPILLVTAMHSAHSDILRGYAEGAVDYLLKPLEPPVVRGKVEVFVRLFQQRQLIAHQALLLEESNRKLSRVNAELDRFASVAAHDLKNPVSTMMACADLLLLGKRPEAQRAELLERIRRQGARATELIDDLLEYSRCGACAAPLAVVDAGEVVERAAQNLEALIRKSGARLEIEPLPLLRGDFGSLVRLFQNLIANAIIYRHPDRPLVVRIGGGRQGDDLAIWVRDNGIGIAPRFALEIFEPFKRGPAARSEQAGTGIGLAISRKIVEQHGGRIWVDSEEGKGSTFVVALPVAATADTAPRNSP